MTDKEALDYFYRQMENGNIKSDEMQLAYECAIEILEKNKEEKIKVVDFGMNATGGYYIKYSDGSSSTACKEHVIKMLNQMN